MSAHHSAAGQKRLLRVQETQGSTTLKVELPFVLTGDEEEKMQAMLRDAWDVLSTAMERNTVNRGTFSGAEEGESGSRDAESDVLYAGDESDVGAQTPDEKDAGPGVPGPAKEESAPNSPGQSKVILPDDGEMVTCVIPNENADNCGRKFRGEWRFRSLKRHINACHYDYYIKDAEITYDGCSSMVNKFFTEEDGVTIFEYFDRATPSRSGTQSGGRAKATRAATPGPTKEAKTGKVTKAPQSSRSHPYAVRK